MEYLSRFIVRELGKGEYDVWDGVRRVRILMGLGKPSTTLLPAIVIEGMDEESVVAQMNINQVRERLSPLAGISIQGS